jgi:hypothetical protein
MRALSVAAALFALVGGAAALDSCTGEASFVLPPVDPGFPSTRHEAVCAAWARRACSPGDACPTSSLDGWKDDSQCVARETLVCELQGDDPEVRFDPAAVEACTFDAGCPGVFESPSLCLPPGRAPLGAPCVSDSGCESGKCQYPWPTDGPMAGVSAPCGTCQVPLQCSCASNQECVVYYDHVTCLTLHDAGDRCGPSYACNNSECITPEDGGDGVCEQMPTASLGMPCSSDGTGPRCASTTSTLFCDRTGHCQQESVAAGYGQSCLVDDAGVAHTCVAFGWCDPQTGICQPPEPDGEPCELFALPCLPPAVCLQGSCIFPSLASCGL